MGLWEDEEEEEEDVARERPQSLGVGEYSGNTRRMRRK